MVLIKLNRFFFPRAGLPMSGEICMCVCMCIRGYVSKHTNQDQERESLIKIRFLDAAWPCGVGKMIGLW